MATSEKQHTKKELEMKVSTVKYVVYIQKGNKLAKRYEFDNEAEAVKFLRAQDYIANEFTDIRASKVTTTFEQFDW